MESRQTNGITHEWKSRGTILLKIWWRNQSENVIIIGFFRQSQRTSTGSSSELNDFYWYCESRYLTFLTPLREVPMISGLFVCLLVGKSDIGRLCSKIFVRFLKIESEDGKIVRESKEISNWRWYTGQATTHHVLSTQTRVNFFWLTLTWEIG